MARTAEIPVRFEATITGLKCAPCTDQAITTGTDAGDVPAAYTLAPVVQTFNVGGGQQIAAPIVIPVCWDCRKTQLAPVSRTGLVTA